MSTHIWVLPKVWVSVDSIDKADNRSALWHQIAGDVGVLVEHSPHSRHWREQPQTLLDAVLEVNKMLEIITGKQ